MTKSDPLKYRLKYYKSKEQLFQLQENINLANCFQKRDKTGMCSTIKKNESGATVYLMILRMNRYILTKHS